MDFREKFLVPPGSKIKLADIDPAFTAKHVSHETAVPEIARHVESLARLQYKLYTEGKRSLLPGESKGHTGKSVRQSKRVHAPKGCRAD
jgi:hypothetical protein